MRAAPELPTGRVRLQLTSFFRNNTIMRTIFSALLVLTLLGPPAEIYGAQRHYTQHRRHPNRKRKLEYIGGGTAAGAAIGGLAGGGKGAAIGAGAGALGGYVVEKKTRHPRRRYAYTRRYNRRYNRQYAYNSRARTYRR